jgi:DNA-binding NarL/FixJ family response regulator
VFVKILLADDQELVRDAIAAFLRQDNGFNVSVAADFAGAVAAVRTEGGYDLVLLDYTMPGMNGLSGLAIMKRLQGGKPVAILSGTAPRSAAEQALAEGAAGFLPKTMSTRALVAAVRFMAAGEVYAPISMMTDRDSQSTSLAGAQLTPRELDVLKRLCRGMANKEIARELDLQEVTVKLHIKTLYRKIEAKNRTHAAMIAKEAGVV